MAVRKTIAGTVFQGIKNMRLDWNANAKGRYTTQASRASRLLPGMITKQPVNPVTSWPLAWKAPDVSGIVKNGTTYHKPMINVPTGTTQVNNGSVLDDTEFYKLPTSKTPLSDRSLPKDVFAPNYSDIDVMDNSQLRQYMDEAYIKGGVVSKEEQARLLRAQRRMQELQIKQLQDSQNNPYTTEIARAQADRAKIASGDLTSEQIKSKSIQEKVLNEQQREQMIQAEELAKQEKERTLDSLNRTGMAASTVAQNALQQIDMNLTKTIKLYDDIRIAELAKRDEEMRGGNLQRIQQYDTYINQLQQQSQEYQNSIAEQINEFNQSANTSYEEKLQNLFSVSQSLEKQTNVEYDEEDDATAQNYAAIILDSKGDIDKDVLGTVPQYLIPLVYKYAATMRGLKGKEYDFMSGKRGVWTLDPETGEPIYTPEPWDTYSWQSVDKTKYGSTPAVRNNNPWNISDTSFGGEKIPWERFTVFATPKEWRDALVAKIKYNQTDPSSRYYGKSILDYFKIYAPEGENDPVGYANSVAKALGVGVNTKVSQVDASKFAEQIAKHEDKNSYQMLQDMGIIGFWESLNSIGNYLIQNQNRWVWFSEEDVKQYTDAVNYYVQSGNSDMLWQLLRENIMTDKNMSEEVYKNQSLISEVETAKQLLDNLASSWTGNTWFLSSIAEQLARRVGTTTSVELAKANNQLGILLANYIRSISGTAASDTEVSRLIDKLPQIKNSSELNMALITQIVDQARANARKRVEFKYKFTPRMIQKAFPEFYSNTEWFGGGISSPVSQNNSSYDLSKAR